VVEEPWRRRRRSPVRLAEKGRGMSTVGRVLIVDDEPEVASTLPRWP